MAAKSTHFGITVRNVTKAFPGRDNGPDFLALDDVSLDIGPGEFLALVGPSGCGKSTLLDLIAGLSTPTSGELLLGDTAITGPGLDRGVVFQQYALFPWRTAQANIEFGLEIKGVDRRARAERAREVLELVGLTPFAKHYPHELSGGMRQRVAIARSLAYEPEVLLMDEPYAALDAQTREALQSDLRDIWERTGTTILFITHGIDEAVFLGQRVAVMTSQPGRIKTIIPIELDHRDVDDLRSTPEFVAYRRQIWGLLHEEVRKAFQAHDPALAAATGVA
ncbi:ABC transporter ATP-binding protein [Mycolicibacterium sp.]|uniref:ABC transporter ATP-binding protein n=1 Tax=Mycolicibacterium sp. TaxID=2320850 RepID=UPI003D106B4C